MAWREVRRNHKLIFRYDPEQELIEVKVHGRLEVIALDDYRPAHRRLLHSVGVNFAHIDGIDDEERVC